MRDENKDIFESLLDSVIVVDKAGKINEVNHTTIKLLSYEKKENLIGLPMRKIYKDFSLSDIRNNIPLEEQDLIYLDNMGREIPVSVNIIKGISNPQDIIFMARDTSKTKELINELIQSKEELRNSYAELNESKDEVIRSEKLAYTGRIAASIAHEIRNPLTNVIMAIGHLKETFKPDELNVKDVAIIERNTERINYLITELLNCARPPRLNIHPYDVHTVLKTVLEATKTKIKAQRIKVVKRFTTKPSTIKMDKEHIERAFLNIVINAIESMPKGGDLTIITEVNRNFFIIKIQDTGGGILEKDIIKVFDPFFTTKPKGVGLGLAVCYGIIVSHGGTIEVQSKRKKGSVFTVSLPLPKAYMRR